MLEEGETEERAGSACAVVDRGRQHPAAQSFETQAGSGARCTSAAHVTTVTALSAYAASGMDGAGAPQRSGKRGAMANNT